MSEPLTKRDRDTLARMAQAFDKIDRLLLRLGLQGLQRMTESSATELQALEQTAHNAALITIERQLGALRTHVQRYLDKDPLFNMPQYMGVINRIWLLNRKARALCAEGLPPGEMIDLNGELRRSYELVGEPLTLQPLGASGWVTDTDFVGVTIYFFVDGRPDQIYQASNAKPTAYFGRDPSRLLHQTISDHVPFTIHSMAHGAFQFRNAKLSRDGRLSLHKDLRVKKAPYIGARAYEALSVEDWVALSERIKTREVDPIHGGLTYAFIAPASLGELSVAEKSSRVMAEVYDARGAQLLFEVSMRAENNLLIDNLEMLFGAPAGQARRKKSRVADVALKPDAFFGTAWIAGGHLKFNPYTAIYNQPVILGERGQQRVNEVHLSLESLAKVSSGEGRMDVRKRKKGAT